MTSFETTWIKLKVVYKILKHIISIFLMVYIVLDIILELFLIYKVIISLSFSVLIIYNIWFKNFKKHKQYIKRAEKYDDIFNDKEKAIKILRESLNLNNSNTDDVGFTSIKILYLYLEQNRIMEAEEFFNQSLKINLNEKFNGSMMFQIATYYSEHKEYSKATEYFKRSLSIVFKYPREVHLDKKQVLLLIKTYIKDNQKNEAKKIYNKWVGDKIIKKNKKVEEILNDF